MAGVTEQLRAIVCADHVFTTDVAAYANDWRKKYFGKPLAVVKPGSCEEVAAIGFPTIPLRNPTLVMHVGTVEALPTDYYGHRRFIQVSFQSGGGLSGGCLIDKAGFVLGVMIENVFMGAALPRDSENSQDEGRSRDEGISAPPRPYGQAVPIEYFDEMIPFLWYAGVHAMTAAPTVPH